MLAQIKAIHNLRGEVQLPLSKSVCNRLQIINALVGGVNVIQLAESTDSAVLEAALHSENLVCNVADAGTAFRFLTAYFAATPGINKVLTGTPRLRERPIADLVQALQNIGADITYADKEGFAPLSIRGKQLQGGKISIQSNISSQFISALCMIAPYCTNGLEITLLGEIVSKPYIDLTLSLMQQSAVASNFEDNTIKISSQKYMQVPTAIEADWSAASFYLSTLMLCEGKILLKGLGHNDAQGDKHYIEIAKQFGVTSTFINQGLLIEHISSKNVNTQTIDMRDRPDAAVPFIVACALKFQNICITGLSTLIDKECNRIEALQTELQKIGLVLSYTNDELRFGGSLLATAAVTFLSHHDHRIAMALSLVACLGFDVSIEDAECVAKSYASYFIDLKSISQDI
jgi:3-phosphoshikimate 1-carboxyvinyltransferase